MAIRHLATKYHGKVDQRTWHFLDKIIEPNSTIYFLKNYSCWELSRQQFLNTRNLRPNEKKVRG